MKPYFFLASKSIIEYMFSLVFVLSWYLQNYDCVHLMEMFFFCIIVTFNICKNMTCVHIDCVLLMERASFVWHKQRTLPIWCSAQAQIRNVGIFAIFFFYLLRSKAVVFGNTRPWHVELRMKGSTINMWFGMLHHLSSLLLKLSMC